RRWRSSRQLSYQALEHIGSAWSPRRLATCSHGTSPGVGIGSRTTDGVATGTGKTEICLTAYWSRRGQRRFSSVLTSGSVAPVDEAHRLGPGDVAVAEDAAHRRGHRARTRLAHPA